MEIAVVFDGDLRPRVCRVGTGNSAAGFVRDHVLQHGTGEAFGSKRLHEQVLVDALGESLLRVPPGEQSPERADASATRLRESLDPLPQGVECHKAPPERFVDGELEGRLVKNRRCIDQCACGERDVDGLETMDIIAGPPTRLVHDETGVPGPTPTWC
jgi:hypothetical protein